MKVLTLNKISPLAGKELGENYQLDEKAVSPEAILVRAYNMHEFDFDANTKFVARCGAGVNNIPLDKCAQKGIIVCNTPGANSNAVKELAVSFLTMCGRKIAQGIKWTQGLKDGETSVQEQVEAGKKDFVGGEIAGKTLGVVGLGVIGKKVAKAAMALDMKVIYYMHRDARGDENFPQGAEAVTLEELFKQSDYITLHVPLLPTTKGIINAKTISSMKKGVNIINTARGELVVDEDIIEAVKSGHVNRYCTDFPNQKLLGYENIITTPHIGASTPEAEDNCAVIAAQQLKQFDINKNIVNSVNFPCVSLKTTGQAVLVLFSGNGEGLQQAARNWKLNGKVIKSDGKYGAAKFDFAEKALPQLFEGIDGVLKVYL